MKKLSIFLILLCAIGAAQGQISQSDEATRLSADVVKLFSEKKYKEAVNELQQLNSEYEIVFEKMMELEEKLK